MKDLHSGIYIYIYIFMSTEAILQNRIEIEPVSVGEDSNTAQSFTQYLI